MGAPAPRFNSPHPPGENLIVLNTLDASPGGSPQAHARSYKAWAGDFAMMEFMSEKADMTAFSTAWVRT